MSGKMNAGDAAVIFGGLAIVVVTGILLALFPTYQLLDMSVIRRPIWNPPQVVVREAAQGLTPDDIARLEQDPSQKELLEGLKQPLIFHPSPSWLGHEKPDLNKPLRGRRFPPNRLLWLFLVSVVGYIFALKHRGII